MHDLHRAAREAAELMERFSRTSHELSQSNRHSTEQLQLTVRDIPVILRQAADQSLKDLSAHTIETVRHGLNVSMQEFSRQLQDNTNRLNSPVALLGQSQLQADRTIRKLGWLTGGLVLLVLLVAIGLGSVLWHYKGEVDQYRIEAELLRAYNQADVTLCDGRLCARVERPDRRFGEYQPVKPRPSP